MVLVWLLLPTHRRWLLHFTYCTHTHKHTLGGTARIRNLYLTTHNTHNRQTSILPAGFEPTIPASERPQTARLPCLKVLHFILRFSVIYYCQPRSLNCKKITINFVMSVRLSVGPSGRPRGTAGLPSEDFHENLYLDIFFNMSRKFKFL
jgi:hypothetical protein